MATGDRTVFPKGVSLRSTATGASAELINTAAVIGAKFDNLSLADVDRVVTSANMKVGAYTIANAAATDGYAHKVTITHTQVGGVSDTLGTITIVGIGVDGSVVTEVMTPSDGGTATSTAFFKSVTSATGAGWVVDTTADTITIGFNAVTAFPFAIENTTDVLVTIVGTSIVANTIVAGAIGTASFDASAVTYDGAKDVIMFVRV